MFQNKKNIEELKTQVNDINSIIKTNSSTIESLNSEILKLKSSIYDHNTHMKDLSNAFKENMDTIKITKQSFEKELYDFKILKSQLQNKLIEKFDEELQKNLITHNNNINTASQEYNKLKLDIQGISNKTLILSSEIDKFKAISNQIKQGDFELKKFADELLKADSEKLELLRKIDNLERLISKMRRTR